MAAPGDLPPQQILADEAELETSKAVETSAAAQSVNTKNKIVIPKNCVVTINGQKCHLKVNPATGSLIAQPIKESVTVSMVTQAETTETTLPVVNAVVSASGKPCTSLSDDAITLPADRDSSAAQGLLQLSSTGEASDDSVKDSLSARCSDDILDEHAYRYVPKFIIPSAGGKMTVSAITQEKVSGLTKLDTADEATIEELANQEDDKLDSAYTETDTQMMKKELKQFLIKPVSDILPNDGGDTSGIGNLGVKTSNLELGKLRCDDCDFQGYYPQQYENHLRECHADTLLRCKCCKFICLEEADLTKHYQSIHSRNICDVCHFVSEHAYIVKRHMYRHTADGCSCDICGKTYKDHYILKMHVKMVHMPADVLYECTICSKKFTRKAHLKRHTRTHASEKAFKCPQCDYRGCERSDITKHMLIHEEPKHVCEICSKPFRHQKNKDLHMKRHAGQRDYKCGVCDFFGYTFTDIRKHIERRHSEMKANLCDKCGATFRTEYDLQAHKLTWHQSEHMTVIDTSSTDMDQTMQTISVQEGTTLDSVSEDHIEGHIEVNTITSADGEKITVFNTSSGLDSDAFTTATEHAVEEAHCISDLTL